MALLDDTSFELEAEALRADAASATPRRCQTSPLPLCQRELSVGPWLLKVHTKLSECIFDDATADVNQSRAQ
jgi:hypothetical protein